MRIIVHAGLPKTGSTSLQAYFSSNRAAFAHRGVHYPDFGHASHWPLVAELAANQERGADREPGYLRKLAQRTVSVGALHTLSSHILQNRCNDHIILISHENFSNRRQAEGFQDFIFSIDATIRFDLVAYCRHPVSHYPSTIPHLVRRVLPISPPSEWDSPHVRRTRALRSALGERLTLRAFARETLIEGDIVADFIDWFARSTGRHLPGPDRVFASNVSLSGEACALILSHADDLASPLRGVVNLIQKITAFDTTYGFGTRLVVPEHWVGILEARNREGWNSIVATLSNDEATRRMLQIAPVQNPRTAGGRAGENWVRSYFSEEYQTAFLTHLKASEELRRLAR